MPKVVLCKALQEKEEKKKMLLGVLAKYRQINDLPSWGDAALQCGLTRNILYRRIKEPDDFTIGELRQIIQGLKIPPEEIKPYIC